ncbi:MAG: hypothetical protein IBJ09_16105 [Bacteroidia bacterium]|nr:hypothetical protein [Bacteroidia bacterium]
MKNARFFMLPLVYGLLLACGNTSGSGTLPSAPADSLQLRVEARYAGAVGWSELYDCRVQEVLYGNPDKPQFTLYAGISPQFNRPLQHAPDSFVVCTLSLRLYKENDPQRSYAVVPGFKDKKGNDWELTDVKP